MRLHRLEQPPLGTGERSLEIDRFEPIRPVFDRGAVGLRGLLLREQDRLIDISRVEFEPALPCSVNSLLAADLHDVGSIAINDLGGMFADKHGFQFARLDVAAGRQGYLPSRLSASRSTILDLRVVKHF